MEAVETLPRPPHDDPAKWPSLVLSAVVHLLLIGALFLGVQWKSQLPSAVEVEVWRTAPAAKVVSEPEAVPEPKPEPRPAPKPEPKREPKPEPKPEPRPVARAIAKPEPKPEPKPPIKPDIPLKEDKKLKEPQKKEEPKVKEPAKKDEPKTKEAPRKEDPKAKEQPTKEEPKPKDPPRKEEPKTKEPRTKEPKPEPERRPNFDDELKRDQKQLQQQKAAQEQRARADAEARQLKQLAAEQAGAERKRGLAEYVDKVRGKIRGNISLPPGIQGNPQAEFEVTQLPTGEVLDVKLRRSSGNPALDAAVERAIRKSSPLPKPADPELFERVLKIPYKPRDD